MTTTSHDDTPTPAGPEEAPGSLLPTNQFKVLAADKADERLSTIPPPPVKTGSRPAARVTSRPRSRPSWVAHPGVMLSAGAVFAFAVGLSLYTVLR